MVASRTAIRTAGKRSPTRSKPAAARSRAGAIRTAGPHMPASYTAGADRMPNGDPPDKTLWGEEWGSDQ